LTAPVDASVTRSAAGYAHRVTRNLIVLMSAAMVLSSLAVAALTLGDFNRLLAPELELKARMIGHIVQTDFTRALEYGIPLDEVYGVNSYLATVLKEHDELTYVVIVDAEGKLRYEGGNIWDSDVKNSLEAQTPAGGGALDYRVPISTGESVVGTVHVGIDRRFVQRQLDDILFDIIVILVTAVLVTFEVMLALLLVYGTGPIRRLSLLLDQQARGNFAHVLDARARDAVGRATHRLSQEARSLHAIFRAVCERLGAAPGSLQTAEPTAEFGTRLQALGARFGLLNTDGPRPLSRAGPSDVRIPLFVFAFAEELQKSFLPLFVREIFTPVPWLSEPVVIGLPIAVYLVVLALAGPFAGTWAGRYGSRRLFLAGVVPAVAGFLGCAAADSIGELVAWRGVTALGYAMVTIGCQDYVIATSGTSRWGRNLIVFAGVIMSATMCGTAIGAILADRLGYRAVFIVAALLAVFGGMLAAGILRDERDHEADAVGDAKPQAHGRLKSLATVLANGRFMLFLLCIAVPANVLIAAYLWYMVPLYLSDLGASTSEIGRVIMAYYLLIVVVGPLASQFVDKPGRLGWLVGLGSVASAAGLIAFHDWQSIWAVVLTVIMLGLTHAVAKGGQVPLALEICAFEITLVGRNTVLSILRFLERMGSVVGLLVAAVLIEVYGYEVAIGVTGSLVSGAALLFLVARLAGKQTGAAPV
jgi:MFS family permease